MKRHVQPKEAFIFEPWQSFTVGWDYGFGHWAGIFWLTKAILKPNPKFGWTKPKLVNVFTRELLLHENTPKQQTEALIASIPMRELTDQEKESEERVFGYKEILESVHFSWERFNRTVSNFTVADEVGDLLAAAGLPRPTRSNTDRIAGWTKMYTLLDLDDLFVLDTCPILAEAIPLAVRDSVKIEDVLKPKGVSQVDDALDGSRYAIAGALLDADEKPEEEKFREELAKTTNPMMRHIKQFRKWKEQEKEGQPHKKAIILPSWRGRLKP